MNLTYIILENMFINLDTPCIRQVDLNLDRACEMTQESGALTVKARIHLV